MPISQNYIPNLSEHFTELASELDIRIIEELRKVTNRIVQDPDLDFEKRITDKAEDEARKWYEKSVKWIEHYMAIAYLRGLNMQDMELESMGADKNEGNPVPRPRFDRFAVIGGTISAVAKEILKDFPNHWDSYRWYENTFKESVNRVRLPFRQSTVQHYRDIAALAQREKFINESVATRRDLAQYIIDEFAGRGINVIQFPLQHKMSIEAFAHRESRAYLQHVAVQGQINRATERGYDLVRINSYAGASPMCTPHQGNVYSLSGNSDQYPPFSDALFDGTYNYGSGIYHDYSYIEDMETYTKEGWKYIKDLEMADEILSLNPDTHIPEWSNVVRLHSYHHKGKMVELKSNSFDLCVTPDHDLYIGYKGRKKGVEGRVTKYKFCKAEEAIERSFFTQLRCVNWEGESQKVPISGIRNKDFAKLLAWYISDGYCEKPNGKYTKVCIRKEKEPHVSIMKKTLLKLGFKYGNGRFWIYNHEWAEYFSQFGKSHEKYLPKWILNERQEIIKEFLNAYVIGDGSRRTSSYKDFESEGVTYYTSSDRLAEQIGECIIKAGKYPSFSVTESKGVEVEHHNGTYSGNHDINVIRMNNTKESYYRNSPSVKHLGLQAELIDHDDKVYCVTLEKNHILWVRRNGRTTWSGNCGHFQSTYIPGLSESVPITDDPLEQSILEDMGEAEGNRFIYEARQQQRDTEYTLRQLKRKKVASLDSRDAQRINESIKYYQAKMRGLMDEFKFLKRDYTKENL